MEISPVRVVSLKGHPELNERWLQNEIKNDVTILGLGDLIVRDVERREHRAGDSMCSLLTPMVRLAMRWRFSWAQRMNLHHPHHWTSVRRDRGPGCVGQDLAPRMAPVDEGELVSTRLPTSVCSPRRSCGRRYRSRRRVRRERRAPSRACCPGPDWPLRA